ncbi:gdp-mannose-dehydratase [Stylonychia lemnae]|uniref:GDP-mannose 4,6-dehydratase n=1 Tax=Stylonychia lemnae TaxID=5949 RepID=A0A078AXU1_STYLE|nr:gdp-mannose-dehydratase [Stylonychia lemnae]|eukprot:CDW86871.1 gdp-mannose-dehydratase [Stylonychia lemnae]
MEKLYPQLWPKRLVPDDIQSLLPVGRNRTAFLTGITGQDGLYMTAYLLFHQKEYDYTVYGVVRKNSATLPFLFQYNEFLQTLEISKARKIILVYGDVTDQMFMHNAIAKAQPDEIYNFAALSQVQHSFDGPGVTMDTNISGLTNICQAVLSLKMINVRIFHASTSEMFGDVIQKNGEAIVTEGFPFNPMSPYAVSKITNYYQVQFYKNVYKMFICTGLTFNHESPLRQETFITRKITKAVARIKIGLQDRLRVGNIYAKRDWGHAFNYVQAFWKLLNKQDEPDDLVIATCETVSVKEFIEQAFRVAGYTNIEWKGEGSDEKLIDRDADKILLEIDPQFYRPGEVPFLRGNPQRIKEKLGWEPNILWRELLEEMLEYDLKLAKLEENSLLQLQNKTQL